MGQARKQEKVFWARVGNRRSFFGHSRKQEKVFDQGRTQEKVFRARIKIICRV